MIHLPNILIINDGNRRWAKERNLTIKDGYQEMVRKIAYLCDELYTRKFCKLYITFCSVNNLARPLEIVNSFYQAYLSLPQFSKNKIKIELHGNIDLIPEHYKRNYIDLVNDTRNNSDFILHCMINWSTNDEIIRIYNRLHKKYTKIDIDILNKNSDILDPIDLIIRTGKKKRLSSCIPINSPFAEVFFADILFPDISIQHIEEALEFYQGQQRNYGK